MICAILPPGSASVLAGRVATTHFRVRTPSGELRHAAVGDLSPSSHIRHPKRWIQWITRCHLLVVIVDLMHPCVSLLSEEERWGG